MVNIVKADIDFKNLGLFKPRSLDADSDHGFWVRCNTTCTEDVLRSSNDVKRHLLVLADVDGDLINITGRAKNLRMEWNSFISEFGPKTKMNRKVFIVNGKVLCVDMSDAENAIRFIESEKEKESDLFKRTGLTKSLLSVLLPDQEDLKTAKTSDDLTDIELLPCVIGSNNHYRLYVREELFGEKGLIRCSDLTVELTSEHFVINGLDDAWVPIINTDSKTSDPVFEQPVKVLRAIEFLETQGYSLEIDEAIIVANSLHV